VLMKECGHVYVWAIDDVGGVIDTECERPPNHKDPHHDGVIWWDDEQNRVDAPD
jgi:hypothetical protein